MKVRGLVPNFDNPASVTGALQNLLGGAKNPYKPRRHQDKSSPYKIDRIVGWCSLVVRAQFFSGDWLTIEKNGLYRVIALTFVSRILLE